MIDRLVSVLLRTLFIQANVLIYREKVLLIGTCSRSDGAVKRQRILNETRRKRRNETKTEKEEEMLMKIASSKPTLWLPPVRRE